MILRVKTRITDKTCAIITETVQEEVFIRLQKSSWKAYVSFVMRKDIILIWTVSAVWDAPSIITHGRHGVQPDIMTCAKALGCRFR